MNRHRERRIEAIARQRAYIDNQLQLLVTPSENRVPNIIRSRGGRPTQPRLMTQQVPMFRQFESVEVESLPVEHDHQQSITMEEMEQEEVQAPVEPLMLKSEETIGMESFNGGVYHQDGETVYVTFEDAENVSSGVEGGQVGLNGGGGAQGPITSTSDFSEFLQPLQTIQTEDGIIMVVLEGSDVYDKQGEVGSVVFENSEAASADAVQTVFQANVANDVGNNGKEEVEEESYVIVQTPDGDVLIPSSACSDININNINNNCTNNSSNNQEQGIVEFVAAESGAIEKLMATSKSSAVSKPVILRGKTSARSRVGRYPNSLVPNKSKVVNQSMSPKIFSSIPRKLSGTTNSGSSRSPVLAIQRPEKPTTSRSFEDEEKPRPYRFELPDFEEDLGNGFMSVPIPIQIDSLRSATEVQLKTDSNPVQPVIEVEGRISEKCSVCQLEFASRKAVVEHMETQHSDLRPFSCKQCGEAFSFESSLANHIRLHERQKKFQCQLCQKLFQLETTYTSHQKYCGKKILSSESENTGEHVCVATESLQTEGELFVRRIPSCDLSSDSLGQSQEVHTESSVTNEDETVDKVTDSAISLFSNEISKDKGSRTETQAPENTSQTIEIIANTFTHSIDKTAVAQFAHDTVEEPVMKKAKTVDRSENCLLSNTQEIDNTESHSIILKSDLTWDGNSSENSIVSVSMPSHHSSKNCVRNGDELIILDSLETNENRGRRTINKATAKATMSKEVFLETWESQISENSNEISDFEATKKDTENGGGSPSLQSARIRVRNNRIREMDGNPPNKEQIGDSFRNIFQQVVVKQNTAYN